MKTHHTGHPAPYGVYLSWRPLDLCFVGSDGEALAGKPGAVYRRLPSWLVFLCGPLLGGAFVLLFPMLVFAAAFVLAGRASLRALRSHAQTRRRSRHLA